MSEFAGIKKKGKCLVCTAMANMCRAPFRRHLDEGVGATFEHGVFC